MALVVKNLPANAGEIRDMGSIPGLQEEVGRESEMYGESNMETYYHM